MATMLSFSDEDWGNIWAVMNCCMLVKGNMLPSGINVMGTITTRGCPDSELPNWFPMLICWLPMFICWFLIGWLIPIMLLIIKFCLPPRTSNCFIYSLLQGGCLQKILAGSLSCMSPKYCLHQTSEYSALEAVPLLKFWRHWVITA